MPQDSPAATDLLDVVALFLEHEVIPSTEGGVRFRARVAANTLRIVAREIQRGERHLRDEVNILTELLGQAQCPAATLEDLSNQALALNRELCERIRAGNADADPVRTRVVHAMRKLVESKLAIANPAYLETDRNLRTGNR